MKRVLFFLSGHDCSIFGPLQPDMQINATINESKVAMHVQAGCLGMWEDTVCVCVCVSVCLCSL